MGLLGVFTPSLGVNTPSLGVNTPSGLFSPALHVFKFAIDYDRFYNTNSVYNCSVIHKESINYLLAILNNSVTTFWFNIAFMNIDGLFPHIQKNQLEEIPIPIASKEQQDKIVALVDKILEAKRANPQADTSREEQAIDRIVYHLYSLTYAEVRTIDPDTTITEEIYNFDVDK